MSIIFYFFGRLYSFMRVDITLARSVKIRNLFIFTVLLVSTFLCSIFSIAYNTNELLFSTYLRSSDLFVSMSFVLIHFAILFVVSTLFFRHLVRQNFFQFLVLNRGFFSITPEIIVFTMSVWSFITPMYILSMPFIGVIAPMFFCLVSFVIVFDALCIAIVGFIEYTFLQLLLCLSIVVFTLLTHDMSYSVLIMDGRDIYELLATNTRGSVAIVALFKIIAELLCIRRFLIRRIAG